MKWKYLTPRKLNFWDCETFEDGSSDCMFDIVCQWCEKTVHTTTYDGWTWTKGEKSGMSKIFAFCTQRHFEKFIDYHLSVDEKKKWKA